MTFLQTAARHTAGLIGRESWVVRRLRPLYESLLSLQGGEGGIAWEINGVSCRIDPHYRHMLWQDYDAAVASFLRERVRPGALCLDVGANVGVYVLQFAHWSAPSGQVIAFEPNPVAQRILQKHVSMNELSERVRIVPAAVGESNGQAILHAVEADGMSRLGEPNKALAGRTREINVPLLTLDHYCQTEKLEPDWLFIDIEGFEIAALAGARELIKSRRGELGLVVEMHPGVWDSANTTRAGAESLLADLRLDAVPLTGQSDPLSDYGIVHLVYQ
jgi:FkbM family methyltransferase